MVKQERVARPIKKTEYEILFASREAQRGWRDLVATQRTHMADAWDFLAGTSLHGGRVVGELPPTPAHKRNRPLFP